MKVLHLMASGSFGGIEVLMRNYSARSVHENIFMFVWDEGEIAQQMRSSGLRVEFLDAGVIGQLKAFRKILTFCKKEKVDVIISHHGTPLFWAVNIAMKVAYPACATVLYVHACRDFGKDKGLRDHIAKFLWKRAIASSDAILAISHAVKRSVGAPERHMDKIRVLHNGVPLSDFVPEIGKKRTNRLVYVGRLIQGKGVQYILKAMAGLPADVHYELDIVGDGDYRSELEQLACQLGIEDRVRFCGSQRNVAKYLAGGDVFIHMPVFEEGFGITVVEAMAAGLVCVCADSGGIPEIIDEGVNGFMVKKCNAAALSARLEAVYKMDPQAFAAMQEQAVKNAQRFSLEYYTKVMDETMQEWGSRRKKR